MSVATEVRGVESVTDCGVDYQNPWVALHISLIRLMQEADLSGLRLFLKQTAVALEGTSAVRLAYNEVIVSGLTPERRKELVLSCADFL
jgi:hypothetical protein